MNKFISSVVISGLAVLLPTAAFAQAIVVSQDGTFLGVVSSNSYNSNSICNEFGRFGSPFGNTIFNKFGTYGGEYSPTGAYNTIARKPPLLVKDNQVVGVISKNRNFENRIDPDLLLVEVCGR